MEFTLYVSPNGNDSWSGRLIEANAAGTDGPFATLAGARNAVRRLKQSGKLPGSVTVLLRSGRYKVTEPVVFGPEDSAPVTYAAYPDEEPIIDGGQALTGWRTEQVNGRTAWVVNLPEVAAGKWHFRSLFVNGHRRLRARLPKNEFYWIEDVPGVPLTTGFGPGTDTFRCKKGDIQAFKNLTDIEIVALHYWIEERMPIASFEEATCTVHSTHKGRFTLRDDAGKRYAKYYLDNVFEGLTEPGEWYLDRPAGKLYYVPMPGEKPETTEVYAPRCTQLLRLNGDWESNKFVEFIRFSGITFEHTDGPRPPWDERKTLESAKWVHRRDDSAGSPQAAADVPGTIQLQSARYCALEDCTVRHVGWYGVELGPGCTGNRLIGNHIADMGAGGVKLNGAVATEPLAARTGNNRITDNHICSGGHIFHSAVGILSMHAFGNEITHNHIHDLYYSGVSVGWVWGYADSVSKDNKVEKNHIHDLGHGWLSDMGGIYTLGVQPGTVIHGNLIHDIEKANYGAWCIYPDEGSSHILIEKNVCYNTNDTVFHQHYGRENMVRNNIFAFGANAQIAYSRAEDHRGFVFERNIVVSGGSPMFTGGYSHKLTQKKILSDLNVFLDTTGQPPTMAKEADEKQSPLAMDEWQELGYDVHSAVADPRFKDLKKFDFTLADDSLAFLLGFEPIDISDVGPRPRDKRE